MIFLLRDRRGQRRGQSVLEFAIGLPLVALALVGAVYLANVQSLNTRLLCATQALARREAMRAPVRLSGSETATAFHLPSNLQVAPPQPARSGSEQVRQLIAGLGDRDNLTSAEVLQILTVDVDRRSLLSLGVPTPRILGFLGGELVLGYFQTVPGRGWNSEDVRQGLRSAVQTMLNARLRQGQSGTDPKNILVEGVIAWEPPT